MINIALYKPDIPQNTAAIIRLSACLNIRLHIIEPCGFNLDDSRLRRVAMDYLDLSKILRYENYVIFHKKNCKSRIILMTTKANQFYHKFKYNENDILLFGRESSGVPKEIHDNIKNKIKVPMHNKTRSLNVAMTVAIVASEALRQNNILPS